MADKPLRKEDIRIEGVDRNALPEREWRDILGFANIGYQTDKRKVFKNSGILILKDNNGLDTDISYGWSVMKGGGGSDRQATQVYPT